MPEVTLFNKNFQKYPIFLFVSCIVQQKKNRDNILKPFNKTLIDVSYSFSSLWIKDQEPFELCCPKMDLKELGAGFPLYFEYVTFCALLLLFQFIVIGLYNMLNNAAGARCRENQDIAASSANRYCTDGFIVTYSWANKDEGYDPNT